MISDWRQNWLFWCWGLWSCMQKARTCLVQKWKKTLLMWPSCKKYNCAAVTVNKTAILWGVGGIGLGYIASITVWLQMLTIVYCHLCLHPFVHFLLFPFVLLWIVFSIQPKRILPIQSDLLSCFISFSSTNEWGCFPIFSALQPTSSCQWFLWCWGRPHRFLMGHARLVTRSTGLRMASKSPWTLPNIAFQKQKAFACHSGIYGGPLSGSLSWHNLEEAFGAFPCFQNGSNLEQNRGKGERECPACNPPGLGSWCSGLGPIIWETLG